MSGAVLDDPGFLAARERFWTAALTDERYRENRAAVAERDGEMIGIAMSGPTLDAAAPWTRQLYVLYVYAADHGTGAGRALLEAVIDPAESAALWVADPNPRAQAFYRKHGFVADGTAQVEDGVREIRMVRDVQHRRQSSSTAGSQVGRFPNARTRKFERPTLGRRGCRRRPIVLGAESVEVAVAAGQVAGQAGIGGCQATDLLTAVALAQRDRHGVAPAGDYPPYGAGRLPSGQHGHRVLAADGHGPSCAAPRSAGASTTSQRPGLVRSGHQYEPVAVGPEFVAVLGQTRTAGVGAAVAPMALSCPPAPAARPLQ